MGFLPKRLTLQNLDQVSVFIEDTNNEYFNVQEVPETITQGRYAFKIFGSDFLREGIELKLELTDSRGNTIYLAPVDFVGEETPPYVPYRYVTIEVYSPPVNFGGLATLTILGEINPDVVDVPMEFQNAYNVRYQKTINVDLSTTLNTQPIRFFKNPTTEFQEVVQAKTVLSAVSQSVVKGNVDGFARGDLKGKIIPIETGSLEKEALPSEVSDTFKDLRRFKDEYKYKTGLRGKVPSIIRRRGLSTVYASKEEPKFVIKSGTPLFSADMQGGDVEIPERQVTITKLDAVTNKLIEETVTVPKFKTKILEVVNDTTIVPEAPPTITLPTGSIPVGTDITEVTLEDFSNTALTASFNSTNTSVSQSDIHFDSLLDLTIKDMRTFSGDIYRVRVHGKSEAAGSDFTVLTDVIVESPELLVDTDSASGVLRTGYFLNQSHVNTYWNKFSVSGTTKGSNVTTTHTGSEFIDSIFISGSTHGLNESVVVENKPTKSFTVRKNVAYTLTAKVKGRTTNKTVESNNIQKKGKLYFHLSGSNLNTSKLEKSHDFFGSELTEDASGEVVVLQLDEDIDGIQNFETIEHTFKPNFKLDRTINTDTILQLRAESGEWFISDISLTPAMDTGFSPDEFKLKVPIPRSTRPDRFDFLVEYFDMNNNVAETVTVIQDVPIVGSALVIDGDGNLLTGSLFLSNAVDSGVEMAGVNSAFVRSVGYEGFESASLGGQGGFMIFSGSVLPDAPDNYQGAGIEIHDGVTGSNESFLKFRTNPSQLDIKTSKFFLGKESNPANFISGSNGNLQISSSNFELSPEGNVTMSGEITAVGGTIGGFDIASTTISTTGIILGNSAEDLFISSSKFKVDHEGNITASNIDLGGTISATSGDVGGFTINAGSLTSGTENSAITMSSADKIIAIGSGSTFNKGDLAGGFRVGLDTDGTFKFAVGSSDSYIHADATGVSIKSDSFDVTASIAELDVDVFKLAANNLFISSSDGGFISAGNPRPTGIDGTNKGIFLRGNAPAALIGDANGSHIKFDGTTTSISSSEFYLGSDSQFVSGSNGNIEISSSNFHLDNSGNVAMQGTITATAGTLGGFSIGGGALSSDNFFISGSSTGNNFFISSSNFNVKASGDVTASALELTGGQIGGIDISATSVSVGSILQLKDSGQITGSSVLFSGGKIAAWNISGNNLSSTGAGGIRLNGNGDNAEISVNSHTFGNSGIQLGYNSGNPRFYVGDGSQNFMKFTTSGGVDIKTLKFELDTSALELSSTQASMSLGTGGEALIRGNSNSPFISLQPSVALVDKSYGEVGVFLGVAGGSTPLFSAVGSGGHFKFNGSTIDINTNTAVISGSSIRLESPKFFLGKASTNFVSGSNGNVEISSSKFHLQADGDVVMNNITASNANISGKMTATSGEIGGFTIGDDLSNSGGSTLKLKGSSGQITASAAQITGKITAQEGTIGGFNIGTDLTNSGGSTLNLKGSTGQITASAAQITGKVTATSGQIAGFTIDGNTLTATNFTLDASGKRVTLGTGNNIFIADGDEGIQLGHATFGSAPFSVTKGGVLKSTSGTIGGWTLSSNTIVGSNLTLNSSGIIETNDFVSGESGFRLDSTDNGIAEFENISIRGTLKTTVFEKESVNAVGGQLYVANSTTLTGSLNISASAATMSVVNATGFTGSYNNDGEILVAKKVTNTGISTEYILVQSASRDEPSSDTNFAGKLYVVRGYQSGSSGDFLGDNANQSQSLAPGQVLASTGRIGTGYIRLNANPTDTTTPYIDIVERTGSGVYDVDLKARLGDLSGLSTDRLHGTNPANAGFGLYSQNVFLEGGIVANTGSIGGINMESGKLYNGVGTHGNSNTGFYVDSGSKFSLGDKLVWDGSTLTVEGAINITSGVIANQLASLNQETGSLQGSVSSLGEATASLQSATGSLENSVTSLGQATASLESSVSSLGQATASLQSATGSLQTNITNIGVGATASASAAQSNAQTYASDIGTGAAASASAAQSNAQNYASDVGTGAAASASAAQTNAQNYASDVGTGAAASASAAQTNAQNYASDVGVGAAASASAAQTNAQNYAVGIGAGATASSSAVQSNLNTVSSSTAERIMTDVSGSILSTPPSPSGQGLFLNFPHMGYYSGSEYKAFISASGGFLFKADDNNLISFGQSVSGGDGSSTKSFVLKSDNVFLSGSNVNILGERFFLGGGSQFVSGSNGNIEISSSKFHVKPDGDIVVGKVNATEGSIGGFDIGSTQISSSNGALVLNADGGITGSKFKLEGGIITADVTIEGDLSANSISTPTGGSPLAQITSQGYAKFVSASIGGFDVSTNQINSTNDNLILKSNGQITASAAKISGAITITGGASFDTINNLESGVTALGQATASLESSVTSLGQATASLESSVSSLGEATASLQNATGSLQTNITNIGVGATASASAAQSNAQSYASDIGTGAAASASAAQSNAQSYASDVGTGAAASASAAQTNAQNYASDVGTGAAASASAAQTNAQNYASDVGTGAAASASAAQSNAESYAVGVGAGATASASAAQTNAQNYAVGVGAGAAASSSAVQANLNTVSSSTALRIMTDATGSILDTPPSPVGSGLYLNFPHLGFYDSAEPADKTYVVTAAGGVYYIDGVQQATVELQVGFTYRFDTSAVGSHPFRFSTTSNGSHGGGSEYTTGVSVGSGYVDITITSSTPSTLYYYCTSHSNMGGQVNIVDNSEYKAFISASGGFLFKADNNNLISFGQSVSGGDGSSTKSFVLKSDNVFLSGSKVNILGERFFLGGGSQFVSGSNGNIEISSSNFHLTSDGNVTMSGEITAAGGTIGGFTIGDDLDSTSGTLKLKGALGQITASAVSMSGAITATSGLIGGMKIESNSIESKADAGDGSTTTYTVTVAGGKYYIDGVQQQSLTFIPGNTYKFDQSDDSNANHPLRFSTTNDGTHGGGSAYTTGVTVNGAPTDVGAYVQIVVTQSTPTQLYYYCANHPGMGGSITVDKTSPLILDGNTGQITGSRVLFDGGTIGGFEVASTQINSTNDNLILKSNGQITASAAKISGAITITSGASFDSLNSLNQATASLESSVTSLGEATASLQSATGSLQTNITNIGVGATASASAAQSNAQSYASDVGTGAAASASAAQSNAQSYASDVGTGAAASASAAQSNAESYAVGVGAGATASASAAQTNAQNYAVGIGEGAAASSSAVQTNLNTVSSSTAERIMTDVSGSILDITPSPAGAGLYLNYPHMGFYDNSEFTAFISASGGFLFKADDNNLISFGQSVSGGDGSSTKSFVLKSDNVFLSGSKVNILGERFFLGGQSQFVSGSNGNIEISSSKFHVQPDGDVVMNNITASNANVSGKMTATSGEIGGFTIGTNLSNSAGGSNALVLKGAEGQISASKAKLTGGRIAKFDFDDEAMFVTTGGKINLAIQHTGGGFHTAFGDDGTGISLGGNADGSDVTDRNLPFVVAQSGDHPEKVYFFVGHKTGSFIEFNGDTKTVEISSSNFLFGGGSQFISGSNGNIEISSSKFHVKPDGDIVVGKVNATEGSIGGFTVESSKLSSLTGDVSANASASFEPFSIELESSFVPPGTSKTAKNQLNVTNAVGKQSFINLKNQYDVGKPDFQEFKVESLIETTSSVLSLVSHIDEGGGDVTSSITMKVGSYRGEDGLVIPSFGDTPNVARFNIVNTQTSHSFSSITELNQRGAAGGNGFIYEGGERFNTFFVGHRSSTLDTSGYIKSEASDARGRVRILQTSANGAFGLGVDPFTRNESGLFNEGILQTISASLYSSTISGSTKIEKVTSTPIFNNGLKLGTSVGAGLNKVGILGAVLTISGSSVFEAEDSNLGGLGRTAYTVFNQDGIDTDFRIESTGNANMFYVDAGNDRVGIGTSTPGVTLEVVGSISGSATSTGSFGKVIVPGEGLVPTSTNIFQANVAASQNINSMGSVLQTMNVGFGTPSVNNSTYIAAHASSIIYISKPGEYAISVDLVVTDSATNDRHSYIAYVDHKNVSGTIQYSYPLSGMYIRSDASGYDAGAMAGQIRLITTGVNDQVVVKVRLLDREETGTVNLDTTYSRIKIDKITYGTN